MTITEHGEEICVRLTKEEVREMELADRWERFQEAIRRAIEYIDRNEEHV